MIQNQIHEIIEVKETSIADIKKKAKKMSLKKMQKISFANDNRMLEKLFGPAFFWNEAVYC